MDDEVADESDMAMDCPDILSDLHLISADTPKYSVSSVSIASMSAQKWQPLIHVMP